MGVQHDGTSVPLDGNGGVPCATARNVPVVGKIDNALGKEEFPQSSGIGEVGGENGAFLLTLDEKTVHPPAEHCMCYPGKRTKGRVIHDTMTLRRTCVTGRAALRLQCGNLFLDMVVDDPGREVVPAHAHADTDECILRVNVFDGDDDFLVME